MTITTKAVSYGRVSSTRQESGYSIPAQKKLNNSYSISNNITIVAEFFEAETAKKAGRKQFNEMVKYLRKHPDVRIILAEKTDRIYRNLTDYVTLDDFEGLEVHLIKENTIISDKSSSHEKFMHGIKVLMAKNYVDNLSEEVIKGQDEKALEGIYPSKAPVGYKNIVDNYGKHIIIEDEERSAFVKKAFDLYATGDYSALRINSILFKEGFRTPRGNKFSKATIERMFKNIFYLGKFEYRGYICEKAQHPRLVDNETFDLIQERLGTQTRARSHSVEFPYSNLITCGICGGKLTAELKKKKYVYYRCNDYYKKGCKKESYLNQNTIDKSIAEILKILTDSFDEKFVSDVLDAIREIHSKKNDYNLDTTETINKQIETIQKRIGQAYIDKVDGKIPEDFWMAQNRAWHAQKDELYNQLKKMNEFDSKFYSSSELLLKFCKDAHNAFIGGNADDKRFITNIVVSNLNYKDRKLSVELHPVFDNLLNCPNLKNGGTSEATVELFATKILSFITTKECIKTFYLLERFRKIA